jgi:rod shape determining protein RodA
MNFKLFITQFYKVFLALLLIYFISKTSDNTWFTMAKPLYFFSLILLMINLLGTNNINRWSNIGGVFIQFSEFAKVSMLLMLSKFLANNEMKPINLIKAICIILTPSILIFKQPNLGTALIFLTTGFSLIWVKGVNKKILYAGNIGACFFIIFLWSKLLPYQKARITAFINPQADPKGLSYQTLQSIIAIGSGGWFGSAALHNKLGFVPENHTDFLFSCFGEHYGFLGTLGLIILIALSLFKLFDIIHVITNKEKRFFCIGFLILWLMQIIMNIGMNIGLTPIAGVTLPFFSYGGSSLLAFSIALGIILNFIKYKT